MPGWIVGDLLVNGQCVGPQSATPGLDHASEESEDGVDHHRNPLRTHIRTGFVGPGRHHRTGVGIVGQPPRDPDPLADRREKLILAFAEINVVGDPRQRADVTANIAAPDLLAAADQHHAECRIRRIHAVPHQLGVPGLKDVERQRLPGQ